MPVDYNIILYSLAKTFNQTFNIDICDDTNSYLKSKMKKFSKLTTDEKIYYTKYSIKLAESLMNYLDKISFFELNTDSEHDIIHDFRLTWEKNNIAHISLSHGTINIKDIIPEKLMKICGYKRSTNICKEYTIAYKKMNDAGYKRIQSKDKYSKLSDKTKRRAILDPACDLVLNTLSKKRKCSQYLYEHLFGESDRIVFKLYKNRFMLYDFGKKMDDVESFRMKKDSNNNIIITFNNKTKFSLNLQTNASEIKPHLSIKFKTTFQNMDELFIVASSSV